MLEADGAGHWLINGEPAPHLDGCLDIDLEASAMTNALPVRRMILPPAAAAAAPAAYVRTAGLAVERLEQTYLRVTGQGTGQSYDYTAPVFDFRCRLVYDQSGLVLEYPGIAVRAGVLVAECPIPRVPFFAGVRRGGPKGGHPRKGHARAGSTGTTRSSAKAVRRGALEPATGRARRGCSRCAAQPWRRGIAARLPVDAGRAVRWADRVLR